jgi:probable HAF family extracellular repeat protein
LRLFRRRAPLSSFSFRKDKVMHTQHQHRRSRRPLALEVLEGRSLMSTYTLADLGPHTSATAINNLGQVVAGTFDGTRPHAFVWDNGKITDVPTLGGDFIAAYGINDAGQVVGWSQVTPDPQAPRHAFLWSQEQGLTDLNTLAGSRESIALAINDAGQVVGGETNGHALLWSDGKVTDLFPGPRQFSTAFAINNVGQVAADSTVLAGDSHATLWDQGQATDLGTLPRQEESHASGINDAGQVVGVSGSIGFVWDKGTLTALPTLGGGWSPAYAVNNAGQVVGMSTLVSSVSHAILYQGGVLQDLNDLVPPDSGLRLDTAVAINDPGQIVVNALDADRVPHAVVLTPDGGGAPRAVDPGVLRVPAHVPVAVPVGEGTSQAPAGAVREQAAGATLASMPAGAAARQATDAVFAGTHRAGTPAGPGGWGIGRLDLEPTGIVASANLS